MNRNSSKSFSTTRGCVTCCRDCTLDHDNNDSIEVVHEESDDITDSFLHDVSEVRFYVSIIYYVS